MKLFLAALVLVALCVVGLCFNIIFRKDGRFPETEIENNREMKKLGIKCVKQEEMMLHRRRKGSSETVSCNAGDDGCGSCAGCSFNNGK